MSENEGSGRITTLEEGEKRQYRKTQKLESAETKAGREAMVKIHIQKGEGDDEKEPVFVAINGTRDFLVPRGVDVEVPESVYNVLMDAKREKVSEDGANSYEVSRFPVSMLGRREAALAA